MNILNKIEILSTIGSPIFTTKRAKELGLSNYDLKLLLKEGRIVKKERGMYALASSNFNEDEEMLCALVQLSQPSCICLLSAVYFYGLTDEIPNETWVYVPYGKFTHRKNIKVIRKRNPYWGIGIEDTNSLRITNIERTIIDCLVDRKHFTEIDAISFARQAIDEELTEISSLIKMAKALKVFSRVKLILTLLQEKHV